MSHTAHHHRSLLEGPQKVGSKRTKTLVAMPSPDLNLLDPRVFDSAPQPTDGDHHATANGIAYGSAQPTLFI